MFSKWPNSLRFTSLSGHILSDINVKEISPITGPEGPRDFQEVKVPRLRDDGPEWW